MNKYKYNLLTKSIKENKELLKDNWIMWKITK